MKQTTGLVLLTLASGQFLMTLDSSVMNVSIATVAKDVGTTVTGIQTAITLYTLVMAMLMIPGGKVGSLIGRKRAWLDRLVSCYGAGSLTTAFSRRTLTRHRPAVHVGPLSVLSYDRVVGDPEGIRDRAASRRSS